MKYYSVYISGKGFPTREAFARLYEKGVTCAFCYADYGAGTDIAVRADSKESISDLFHAEGFRVSVREADPFSKTIHDECFEDALNQDPLHLPGKSG